MCGVLVSGSHYDANYHVGTTVPCIAPLLKIVGYDWTLCLLFAHIICLWSIDEVRRGRTRKWILQLFCVIVSFQEE